MKSTQSCILRDKRLRYDDASLDYSKFFLICMGFGLGVFVWLVWFWGFVILGGWGVCACDFFLVGA